MKHTNPFSPENEDARGASKNPGYEAPAAIDASEDLEIPDLIDWSGRQFGPGFEITMRAAVMPPGENGGRRRQLTPR